MVVVLALVVIRREEERCVCAWKRGIIHKPSSLNLAN
jgi:hypothetical protein